MNRRICNHPNMDHRLWIRTRKSEVTDNRHRSMVVHVEEREPSWSRITEDDQKGVYEFKNLGKVKEFSPEEQRSTWKSMIGREADYQFPIMTWHSMNDGEAAVDGHDEREEAENEAVHGSDAVEGGGGEGGKKWREAKS